MKYRHIFDSLSLQFGFLAFPHKQYFCSISGPEVKSQQTDVSSRQEQKRFWLSLLLALPFSYLIKRIVEMPPDY